MIIGYNSNTPQTTEQKKWQFRDDFSWHKTGMGGLGHDFKVGVNFINEPRLYVTFSSGSTDYAYNHLDQRSRTARSARITRNKPGASANLPMKQFGMYFQDDWRVTDRLTVNAGLRYDLVTGFDLDQSKIPNFIALTGRGRRGTLQRRRRLRRVRHGRRARTPTTGSRASAPSTTFAATARTSSAPDGASTTTSVTPTPTSSSRGSASRAARA